MKTTKKIIILSIALCGLMVILPGTIHASNQVCINGTCSYIVCYSNSDCGTDGFTGNKTCYANSVYQNYTINICNNPGTPTANCSNMVNPKLEITCGYNQGCQNGICKGNVTNGANYNYNNYNYNPPTPTVISNSNYNYNYPSLYPNCSSNFSSKCISNISYWYDSCGNLQTINQNCGASGQICQNGQCIATQQVYTPPVYNQQTNTQQTNTTPSNTLPNKTTCRNNSIYQYSSNGTLEDVKSCSDANSCTVDSCASAQCYHDLRCDGSTCTTDSSDYAKYCVVNNDQNQTQNQTQNSTTTQNPTQNQQTVNQQTGLIISIFGKKDSDPLQWEKSIIASNNDPIDFLLAVKNTSSSQIDNATVSVDAISNITYSSNIKINETISAGNLVSGVNLGSIAANTSKAILFSGNIQPNNNSQTLNIVGRVAGQNLSNSDTLTINITPQSAAVQSSLASKSTAAVSSTPATNGSTFSDFAKKWYIWVLAIIILIALFVVIFRRLSRES